MNEPHNIPVPGVFNDDRTMGWNCCGEQNPILRNYCGNCGADRPAYLEPWVKIALRTHTSTAPAPRNTEHTEAYQRFIRSTRLGYEQWHDGEGYDVAAIGEMTDWELPHIADLMTAREVTWREIEVLDALDVPAAREALLAASRDRLNLGTRLYAAEALHQKGQLAKPMDEVVAAEIRNLHTISNGCVKALLLAEQYPSEAVRQALLWASYNATECSMHCAALLCFLRGVAKESFDWALRPLFLRLDLHNSSLERDAAFRELCALVKMELDTSY